MESELNNLGADDYEIILIDDGSNDRSWNIIKEKAKRNDRIKGVKLSRNFGQHIALSAGLHKAKGHYVIVMDGDLQDQPQYIPSLLTKALQGYDIVYTYSSDRPDTGWRRMASFLYNKMMRFWGDRKGFVQHVNNFSCLNQKVVQAFNQNNDAERQYLMLMRWMGFKHTFMEVERPLRKAGKSTYRFRSLLRLAITGITYQSSRLLLLAFWIGFLLFIISSAAGCMSLAFSYTLQHWLLIALFFCTSLVLIGIGTLGLYLGKVFKQVKNRPLYLVEEEI